MLRYPGLVSLVFYVFRVRVVLFAVDLVVTNVIYYGLTAALLI